MGRKFSVVHSEYYYPLHYFQWQDTEDFGRKKEIRSHMYKLREQRLREFYNNGENMSTEIHGKTIGKNSDTRTHADSLADHSFLSLKTKEIRDSESPTKDSYKISGKGSKLCLF